MSRAAADAPLISIVVPTFRSAAVLEGALSSLATQDWRGFEVIVSDGASDDGTLAIAERFAGRLPALHIDSRPDGGVYDAINRGVRRSRGRWFLVLGSDDRLHATTTLSRVAAELQRDGGAVFVYGDVNMLHTDGRVERYAGPLTLKRMFTLPLCQQSLFYRRDVFDALGGFDLRFRLYADWDFNLRAAFSGPTRWIDLVVADYATTGMSGSASDPVFLEALPGFIRDRLVERADDPASWPLQDHLLRCANRYRRQRRWAEARAYVRSYFHLLARRLPVRVGARRRPR
ncbi:glycosyltransferase family 2 protein [Aquabacterium sp. J223]|uniref:glycosyltransferase family 2 protein n=1 Tax=Aquabacterium sp. J223 TaxID=2898431 RepID=UPI0021ADFE65|nr:glycosyltransferase family 2 protein [Aquabacterium sp. J223]UUX97509.1 glycosyltransferase [Aquabacterium sp. J223]